MLAHIKKITSRILHPFGKKVDSKTVTKKENELSIPNATVCLDLFLKDLQLAHVSESTLRNYSSDISQFLEFTSEPNLHLVLSEQHFRTFFSDQQQKGLKPSTIQRKIVSLKLFSQWVEKNYFSKKKEQDKPVILPIVEKKSVVVTPESKPSTSRQTPQDWILSPYFHLATLFIFFIFISILGYRQFFVTIPQNFAFPSAPITPDRILSFQARLTDAAGNPITTATNTNFKLFDAATSGNQLWASGTCSITPDQDGIFSTILGSTCGSAIASSVFTENSQVWLEVGVASDTLTPRQRIATVPYALNSETIQGFPIDSSASATKSTVLVMNQWGEVLLGEQSPRLRSVSGTFTISGSTLNLTTNTGTNGNIILDPDGIGIISVIGNTVQNGYLYTNGATISATYAGSTPLVINGTGGQILTVNNAGDVTIAGDIAVNGGDITSTTDITINPAGGNVIFADNTVLNIGGASAQAYNFIAGSTAGNSTATNDNDLYIEDKLEVDGATLFDGTVTLSTLNTAGGIVYTNGSGQLLTSAAGSSGDCLKSGGTGSPTWGTCSAGGLAGTWRIANGAHSPVNDTLDLLIGSNATASAKFAVINVNSGTPTASLSAGAAGGAYLTAVGTLQTTANQALTIGGDTTGNITFSPLNGSGTSTFNGGLTQSGGTVNLNVSSNNAINLGTGSSTGTITLGGTGTQTINVGNGAGVKTVNLGSNNGASTTSILSGTGGLSLNSTSSNIALQTNTSGDITLTTAESTGLTNILTGNLKVGNGTPDVTLNGEDGYVEGTFEVDGAARFDGTVTLSTLNTAGGVVYTNGSGQLLTSAAGNSGDCLKSGGTGAPTWSTCSSGGLAGTWRISNGAHSPVNDTLDLLIGSAATSSAKFAFLNVAAGTPTASISANSGNIAAYLTGDGTLATTNRQSLTIGNSSSYNTTGNVLINPNGTGYVGIGTTTPSKTLDVTGSGAQDGIRVRNTQSNIPTFIIGLTDVANGDWKLQNYSKDLRFADGTGIFAMTLKDGGSVGVGSTAPDAAFEINSATGDNLRLSYNDSDGSAANYTDFSISASGDFTLDSSGGNILFADGDTLNVGGATGETYNFFAGSTAGNSIADGDNDLYIQDELEVDGAVRLDNSSITLSAFTTNGGLLYTNGSGVLSQTDVGSSGQCLKSNGGGAPTFQTCATDNFWRLSNGAISPVNDTLDFLIGNTATTSAKFAVINVNSGTPTATLSAGAAGGAYLTATGTLQTTANQTLTLGGSTTGNISLLPKNGAGSVTVTSDLSLGARSADLVTLTQASNASNNSTGNLLQLTNSDSGSTAALLDISTSTGGEGINFSGGMQTGNVIDTTDISLVTGNLIAFNTANITTGGILTNSGSDTVTGALTGFSGDYISIAPTRQKDVTANTVTDSGNFIDLRRNNIINVSGGTFAITGDVATFSSNCTQTLGTCTDTSNILSLAQSYSGASGAVLDITNAGTGSGILLTSSSTGVLATLNSSGAVTTADGLLIAATNGSGIITDALDVSDAEITNALNVGANTITGAGYLVTSTASGLTVNSTAADLALTTTTSGNITATPALAAGLFNILTGNLKVGNATPTVTQDGEDAFIEGTLEVDGAARFDNSSITMSTFTNNGGLLYTNGSGVLAQTSVGSAGECLQSAGGGSPTWGSCGSGGLAGTWRISNGAHSPVNDTLDLLIGSNATTSAKFAVINVNSGTPTASLSANSGNIATYLKGDGTLGTTNRQTLTIGNSSTYNTTGNLMIHPNGTGNVGIGVQTNIVEKLEVGGNVVIQNNNNLYFKNAAGGSAGGWSIHPTVGGTLQIKEESLALTPFTLTTSGNFGFGTTSPDAALEINHATGDSLRLTYNDSNGSATNYTDFSLSSSGDMTLDSSGGNILLADNDVFNVGGAAAAAYNFFAGSTASNTTADGDNDLYIEDEFEVDGAVRFDNSSITLSSFTTDGGLLYTNGSGVLAQTAQGTAGQCLKSNAGGAPTFGTCATDNYWRLSNGALSPVNDTLDFLVGNTATTSAKFAVINVNSGTPTASLSAGAAGGAYLTAAGTLQTTASQTLTVGGSTTGNISLLPKNGAGSVTVTSDLSLGARSADLVTLTQADNGSNNSTGNLLQLTNADGGSTAALLDITQGNSSNQIGLTISGTGTGKSINLGAVQTGGIGIDFSGGLTGSGVGINMSALSNGSGAFSGKYIAVAPSHTHTGTGTEAVSGNLLQLARSTTTNNASVTVNLTGDVATFSSSCTQTLGTCNDTSNILSLAQNYSAASGAVLDITNAGTGSGILLTSSSTGVLATLNSSGAVTTADGLLIAATNGSGIITDALDVSDAEIVNAMNVGANTITGAGYLVTSTASGLTINSTSADLALQTTTSGNITATPALAAGLFNILTGNLKVGNATPTVTQDGEDAFIEGTLEVDGAVRFDNSSITMSTFTTNGGVLYTNGSGVLAQTAAGSLNECLKSAGGGAPTWGSCGGAGSNWRITNGALSPINDTLDLLVGNTATTSAKFAVINVNSGTPTASLSAGAAGGAYLTATGTLQTTANQTLTVGGNTTGNISLLPRNGLGTVTATSDLSQGARTADLVTLTQASNGSNNSTGNLLQLTNSDAGSTVGLLDIAQNATNGYGIEFNSDPTSILISGVNTALTTGTGLELTTSALTSGKGISMSGGTSGSSIAAFTGKALDIAMARTYTGAGTVTDTGNFINVARTGAQSTGAGTYAINGDLVKFVSTCSQSGGTCSDSSHILTIQQNYAAASGSVLDVSNAGTGSGLLLTSSSTGVLATLTTSGAVTTTDGVVISASNGSGIITDALDVSDAEIVNALNVGANTITGAGYLVTSTASGLTVNSTAADLALQTTTSGNITATPALAAGLLNVLTGNLKIGNATPTVTQDGEDAFVEGTFEVDGAVRLDNSSITMSTFTNNGGLLYTNGSGVLAQTAVGSSGQCLKSIGGGAPTFGNCATDNYWRLSNGALSPVNDTLDLLIGNTASTSAKFAVINVNSGTPTATLSAGTAGGAYLTATGSLQTTAKQALTVGGSDSGEVTIASPNTTTFTINSANEAILNATNFTPGAAEGNSLGSATAEWEQLFLGDNNGVSFGLDQDWTFGYDEATDDRLELVTTGTTGMLISSATVSGTGLLNTFDSVTTGTGWSLSADALTTGTGMLVQSTSTAFTSGKLANFEWAPTGSTEIFATGSLFNINLGQFGNLDHIFNVQDNGSDLFSVDQAIISNNIPVEFTAAGDVSVAYDLEFTNQVASFIKSSAPLTIEAGETFENNDLTLKTYGTGALVVSATGGSEFTRSAGAVASFNRTTSDGTILSLQQDGTEEGTISVNTTTVSYNAFTGSHYALMEDAVQMGELVSMTDNNQRLGGRTNSEILYGAKKTSQANDPKVLGAYLALLNPDEPESLTNPYLVMAVGNGEMWIADNGQNIETGDYLISSSTPGHAMKDLGLFDRSYIVARAAEPVDWSTVTEEINGVKHRKISVLFESFTRDNNLKLASDGALLSTYEVQETTENGTSRFSVIKTASSQAVETISAIGQLIVGEIQAGLIKSQQLITSTLTVEEKLTSPKVETNLISPISGEELEINIGKEADDTLEVTNNNNQTVLTIDQSGDATFSGTVQAPVGRFEQLQAQKARLSSLDVENATISGQLFLSDGRSINEVISENDSYLASLSAQTEQITQQIQQAPEAVSTNSFNEFLAQLSGSADSSVSAALATLKQQQNITLTEEDMVLAPDAVFVKEYLGVNGFAQLTTANVQNSLSIGASMILTDNSIAAVDSVLFLQPQRGIINLNAGMLVLKNDGNVELNGNLIVSGDVKVGKNLNTNLISPLNYSSDFNLKLASGSAELATQSAELKILGANDNAVASIDASGAARFKELQTQGIIIHKPESIATDSASLAEAEKNKTVGSAVIPAGATEIMIDNNLVTSDTLIYLTATSNTKNQVLYQKSMETCSGNFVLSTCKKSFTIGIQTPVTEDIQFNYWLIQQK